MRGLYWTENDLFWKQYREAVSAIHDFAWFLDMPKASKYCPALAKIMKMDTCKMVNTAEHQTRKQ